MPLIRIHGSKPEMREDMTKIGTGLTKTANLAYRAQFTTWALKVTGRFNPTVLTADALAYLIQDAGMGAGLGEWRNEKKVYSAHSTSPHRKRRRRGTSSLPARDRCQRGSMRSRRRRDDSLRLPGRRTAAHQERKTRAPRRFSARRWQPAPRNMAALSTRTFCGEKRPKKSHPLHDH